MDTGPADENQSLPVDDLRQLLKSRALFKERSHQTSNDVHVPTLQSHPAEPAVVLLGDSLIEQMKVTGNSPDFQPWPSKTMLSESALDHLKQTKLPELSRLDSVFNAGVGGDRYQNMLYRLVGESNEQRKVTGLLDILVHRNIKLWVVHGGTNNLHRKRGLRAADVDCLHVLLQALLRTSDQSTRVILTGLFFRKDISDHLINEANATLESLSIAINNNLGIQRVIFLPATTAVQKGHLVDHVHLSEEGYRLWAETLFPTMAEVLIGLDIIVPTVTLGVIATIAVVLLFCSRKLKGAHWGADDYLAAITLIVYYGLIIITIMAVRYSGLGKDISIVKTEHNDKLGHLMKILFAFCISYGFASALIKLAVLVFYWRLFPTWMVRTETYVLGSMCVGWFIAFETVSVFQCKPVALAWDFTLEGTCINKALFFLRNSIPNFVMDLAIVILPIRELLLLRILRWKKAGFAGLFLLGGS
ncbi:SGNH hydrolase-type esterase domain-containing protein [Pseudomassariella vexata]|uniref:SGNH hydrolase-type esterase domain-containing protein n=1 Tax=Pseudomassariella vexata TaxID=1141098 RepID=A0A1Y2E4S4_9PEZI|nr:SGNH hydrolase-type esterase domain-containing protein [Pseudomassariella vexata]ORY66522.1 SGNH hydrolase-type esterase domain-containing protein [Pseudomassariella vexata]